MQLCWLYLWWRLTSSKFYLFKFNQMVVVSVFVFLGFFLWLMICGSCFWNILLCYNIIKISFPFPILESSPLPWLRYHIYLIFNVCEWNEVEIYLDLSKWRILPWDTSHESSLHPHSSSASVPQESCLWALCSVSLSCCPLLGQHHIIVLL